MLIADKGYTVTNTENDTPPTPTPPEKTPPTDKKTPPPKTGDDTNLTAYILLMLLSIGTLAAVMIRAKRYRQ